MDAGLLLLLLLFCVCVCMCVCRRLAVDYDDVRPDVVVLGKALSGGTMPVSRMR